MLHFVAEGMIQPWGEPSKIVQIRLKKRAPYQVQLAERRNMFLSFSNHRSLSLKWKNRLKSCKVLCALSVKFRTKALVNLSRSTAASNYCCSLCKKNGTV